MMLAGILNRQAKFLCMFITQDARRDWSVSRVTHDLGRKDTSNTEPGSDVDLVENIPVYALNISGFQRGPSEYCEQQRSVALIESRSPMQCSCTIGDRREYAHATSASISAAFVWPNLKDLPVDNVLALCFLSLPFPFLSHCFSTRLASTTSSKRDSICRVLMQGFS